MRIEQMHIHNFRSILDASIDVTDFMMFVGANNSGKSNLFSALRCFYDDLSWSEDDIPKLKAKDETSYVDLKFVLTDDEWSSLADAYKSKDNGRTLTLRRIFKGEGWKAKQSNIFAIVDGKQCKDLFYGAKNVSAAKCGTIIYIPALTTADVQFKTTGASPFKSLVTFFLKRTLKESNGLRSVQEAFNLFNKEAKEAGGFLDCIEKPINEAICSWGISLDLQVNPIDVNDIGKNLVQPAFIDERIAGGRQGIDRFGSGFQRVMIYELIRASSRLDVKSALVDKQAINRKEFSPDFDLILFEEPEAFLHPSQQAVMALNLRELACSSGSQVFITSHSSVFVGKGMRQSNQVCRIERRNGESLFYQLPKNENPEYEKVGEEFLKKIELFIADAAIDDKDKDLAKRIKKNAHVEDSQMFDKFRFQMWLDSMRASIFFSDRVLLVEGETERVLFNYLLMNEWVDLRNQNIFVVDALGKFNFVRYLRFFKAFGIKHGVIYDEDKDLVHKKVINPFIESEVNQFTLAKPVCLHTNIEEELGKKVPGDAYLKPLEVMKMLERGELKYLYPRIRSWLCSALDIEGVL